MLPLHLTMSNQSFEIPVTRLTVEIDGVEVVDEEFEVRGQHHFVGFSWWLEPGEHRVVVRAPGHDRELAADVEMDGETHVFVSFWAPREDPRVLTWEWSREPFAFG